MKSTIRLWLIKIVLTIVIFFVAVIAGRVITGPGGRINPWAGAIAGVAIIALIKWKPAKSSGSTGIKVKPLNKRDDDSGV